MAIIVELNDECQPVSCDTTVPAAEVSMAPSQLLVPSLAVLGLHDNGDLNMPAASRNLFSMIFACFPAATAITSRLDLNDIDSLALSCRQVRANLVQFQTHILSHSLHCDCEQIETRMPGSEVLVPPATNIQPWERRTTPYKYHECARDLVTFCRRGSCSAKFCRNCMHRGLFRLPARTGGRSRWEYDFRVRRLCQTCQAAPLQQLNAPLHHCTALPHLTMYCTCGTRHVGSFCEECSLAVADIQQEYLQSYYHLATFLSPLCGIHSKSTVTKEFGPILARYDGVPCARGDHCLAARVESSVPASENAATTDATFQITAAQSGESQTTKDPALVTQRDTSESHVSKGRIVAASIEVAENEITSTDGSTPDKCYSKYFMCAEKEGRVRASCAWCLKIVPSRKDRKNWKLV